MQGCIIPKLLSLEITWVKAEMDLFADQAAEKVKKWQKKQSNKKFSVIVFGSAEKI
jgi:hypothetical protein